MPELTIKKIYPKKIIKNLSLLLFSALIIISLFIPPHQCWANTKLNHIWQNIIQMPATSSQNIKPLLKDFIDCQQQTNIKNLSLYSLALLKKAEQKDIPQEVKELLLNTAILVSPDYSFPETAYSKFMFNEFHYIKSLASFFRAIKKFQKNPQESLYSSTFFWLAIAFTPLALLFFTTLILSAKYYRAFCETGEFRLSRKLELSTLFAALFLTAITVIIPAPLVALLFLTVALATLSIRKDIITLAILVSSLLVVPFAYEKGMASLLALNSSFFKLARSSTSGISNLATDSKFRQPAKNQSQLALQLFSQAESARQRRSYAKAEIFLKKILENKIEIAAAYNNLGNLYILQGLYKESEPLFIKAGKLNKESGLPYYNLSQAYILQNFNLEKSSKALETAFKRDPGLVSKQSKTNGESDLLTGNKLLFMDLPDDFYRRYADTLPGKDIYLPEFIKQALFPGANRIVYFIFIILSLGTLIYLLLRAPTNRKVCEECGRLFHPIKNLQRKLCPHCRHSRQMHTDDSQRQPHNRFIKVEVTSTITTTISAIIPGFCQILTNNTTLAAITMLPATLWLYNFIICKTTIMDPFPPSTAWVNSILAIVIWTVNLVILVTLIVNRKRRNNLSRSIL